jgi:signal peptidase I
VAIRGDTLQIINGEIYISGVKQAMPEKAQHNYFVKAKSNFISREYLDQLDIYLPEAYAVVSTVLNSGKRALFLTPITGGGGYLELKHLDTNLFKHTFETKDTTVFCLNMTEETAGKLKNDPRVLQVTKRIDAAGSYDSKNFPHHPSFPWNNDNFGPLLIPKAGMTVPIDTHNVYLYEKVMNTYDDGVHQVTRQGAQVFYDGQPITSYTFKQDYYFMMGDNRHNSADSRSWGLVPFDHVVGSPFFVWFSMKYAENNPVSGKFTLGSFFKNSTEGKFRWERFLCYVEDGTLHSIKIPFILSIFAIWGLSKWNERRKQKQEKASAK